MRSGSQHAEQTTPNRDIQFLDALSALLASGLDIGRLSASTHRGREGVAGEGGSLRLFAISLVDRIESRIAGRERAEDAKGKGHELTSSELAVVQQERSTSGQRESASDKKLA